MHYLYNNFLGIQVQTLCETLKENDRKHTEAFQLAEQKYEALCAGFEVNDQGQTETLADQLMAANEEAARFVQSHLCMANMRVFNWNWVWICLGQARKRTKHPCNWHFAKSSWPLSKKTPGTAHPKLAMIKQICRKPRRKWPNYRWVFCRNKLFWENLINNQIKHWYTGWPDKGKRGCISTAKRTNVLEKNRYK